MYFQYGVHVFTNLGDPWARDALEVLNAYEALVVRDSKAIRWCDFLKI